MKKQDYIEMLLQDNETQEKPKKKLFADVIDCTDIALSQESADFEVDSQIGIGELWKIIEQEGKKSSTKCVGPFQAAELIAERLGANYTRASRRTVKRVRSLEDFL